MLCRITVSALMAGSLAFLAAQTPAEGPKPEGLRQADPAPAKPGEFLLEPGTRVPLVLINSVSTKHSSEGDRVYLQSVFPILVRNKVVIPPGSYVMGTITQLKRPGRIKGRGGFYLRFDSLTLPNGVTRDFRARLGAIDGRSNEELDKEEGAVRSEGDKSGDARTIGEAAAAGASVGVIAGGAAGRYGMGAGIGAAAGAAAGVMGVLLSRGPDAVLAKGSTVEMVLDRPVVFTESELDFNRSSMAAPAPTANGAPAAERRRSSVPLPGRGWPF